MGFFDRLLKRLRGYRQPDKEQSAPPSLTPKNGSLPQFIEVYDGFGRRIKAPREEWRSKVLLPQIAHDWDVPENLYAHVTSALNDGFVEDALMAARRLIDCYPERAEYVNALGCALLKLGSANQAQFTIENHLKAHPPTGYLLTNLAKAYAAQGKSILAEEILWQAANVDPNNPECLEWLIEIARSKGGESGVFDAISRLRSIRGSWRADLLVAKQALDHENIDEASQIYSAILTYAEIEGEAMDIIASDLQERNRFQEVTGLLGGRYSAPRHGIRAGVALAKSYLALRNIKRGQSLIHELLQFGIPEYQETLLDLARQFDELRRKDEMPPAPSEPISINLILLEEPIWRLGLSGARWLSPEKNSRSKSIAIVSFAHIRSDRYSTGAEIEDDGGRFSRAIPLYLMESLHARTDAAPCYVLPVIDGVGPAVSNSPWQRETLERIVSHIDKKIDILVTGDIQLRGEDVDLTLLIWDCDGMRNIENITRSGELGNIGRIVQEIERDFIQFLELAPSAPSCPETLIEPRLNSESLTQYLQCLGQTAALMLARYGVCDISTLLGERSLVGAALDLAIQSESSQAARLLFLTNLWLDRTAGSDIYTEFKQPAVSLLESERPGTAFYNVSHLLYSVFDMDGESERRKERLLKTASDSLCRWLKAT